MYCYLLTYIVVIITAAAVDYHCSDLEMQETVTEIVNIWANLEEQRVWNTIHFENR